MQIGDRIKNMPEEKGQNSSNDISRILSSFDAEREKEREIIYNKIIYNFCQKIIENQF